MTRQVVAVYRPQLCHANLSQVFCSVIDVGSRDVCSAMLGSPVICGDGSSVSGILLNNQACTDTGDLNVLDYHSVGEFREWIEEVSGAEKLAKMSTLLILSAMLMHAKNFL
jgi:hypothetical protein